MTSMKTHFSWRAGFGRGLGRGLGAGLALSLALSFALSLGTLGGCSTGSESYSMRQAQDEYVVTRTPTHGEIYGRPSYDAPINLTGSNTVLIPFAIRAERSWWRKDDPYAAGGVYAARAPGTERSVGLKYLYPMGGQVRWHNAIMRDMATGQERLVLSDRGVIGAWAYYCIIDSATGERTPRMLAFVVVTRDTNRDGDMNDLDSRVLMVAEPNGSNLRAITPEDSQVLNMQYDAELDALMIQLGRDTNRDGRIDFEDVSMPYVWRRGVDQAATPLVSDQTRGRVEQVIR